MAETMLQLIDSGSRAKLLGFLRREDRRSSDVLLSGVGDAIKMYRLHSRDGEFLDLLTSLSRSSDELSRLLNQLPDSAAVDFQIYAPGYAFSQFKRDLPKLLDILGKTAAEIVEDYSGKVHSTGRPLKDTEREFASQVVGVFLDGYAGDLDDRDPNSDFRRDILGFVRQCMECAGIRNVPGDSRLYRDYIYPSLDSSSLNL